VQPHPVNLIEEVYDFSTMGGSQSTRQIVIDNQPNAVVVRTLNLIVNHRKLSRNCFNSRSCYKMMGGVKFMETCTRLKLINFR
jgi:5-methylcytosine-specific restriction endonuclease McrBC regulatory subunit McrC